MLVGALALLAVGALMLDARGSDTSHRALRRPPLASLVANTASHADCGADPRSAAAHAQRAAQEAAEHWQRYPFAPQVGVKALVLQREAAHCRHLAGDSSEALADARRVDAMLSALEHDLQALELRLHRASERDAGLDVTRHARHMLAILPPGDSAYHRFLLALRHGTEAAR